MLLPSASIIGTRVGYSWPGTGSGGKTSMIPSSGSITTIATVALRLLETVRRGGRHTDHGVAKSSKSAAFTASMVMSPICGARAPRTRRSR